MEIAMLYITAPSREVAVELARDLVKERLVACANVFDGATSVFRWEDEIQTASEAVLILKTRTELVDSVTNRVRSRHPYECPCVVAWPASQGHPGFFNWVHAETT